jgi:hypothetical protein
MKDYFVDKRLAEKLAKIAHNTFDSYNQAYQYYDCLGFDSFWFMFVN